MNEYIRFLNRKGITTDVFVIVLLIVGLAVAVGFIVYFIMHGKSSADSLFNLTTPIKDNVGLGK